MALSEREYPCRQTRTCQVDQPGTTLIAAEAIGRIACGIELDPAYINISLARWQQMTGKQAVHAISGKTFKEIAQKRLIANATLEAAE